MTCKDMIYMSIDELIDCEIDCIGCKRTDCPHDKRVKEKSKRSD